MAQRFRQSCGAHITGAGSQVCTCTVWLPPPEKPCLFHPSPHLIGRCHSYSRQVFIKPSWTHSMLFFANLGISQSNQADSQVCVGWGAVTSSICVHVVHAGTHVYGVIQRLEVNLGCLILHLIFRDKGSWWPWSSHYGNSGWEMNFRIPLSLSAPIPNPSSCILDTQYIQLFCIDSRVPNSDRSSSLSVRTRLNYFPCPTVKSNCHIKHSNLQSRSTNCCLNSVSY